MEVSALTASLSGEQLERSTRRMAWRYRLASFALPVCFVLGIWWDWRWLVTTPVPFVGVCVYSYSLNALRLEATRRVRLEAKRRV